MCINSTKYRVIIFDQYKKTSDSSLKKVYLVAYLIKHVGLYSYVYSKTNSFKTVFKQS